MDLDGRQLLLLSPAPAILAPHHSNTDEMKDDLAFILHITNNPFISYYKCKLIIPLKLYKTLQRFNLNKLMQPMKLNVITACMFVL